LYQKLSGYLVGGYAKDGRLIVVKLNSSAHLVFSKEFADEHYNSSSMSRVTTYGSIYNNGLGLHDILLVCLSKNGAVLWKRKFGTPYDDRGIDVVAANDGSIVVLGETYYKKDKTIVLMRVTNYGDKIWYKTYLDKQHLIPYSLAKLRDNKFIISFDTVSNEQQQINLTTFDIGLWMKLSTSLHLILQRHYGGRYFDSFNSFAILRDGNYVVVGNKTGKNPEVSNMWILQLNPSGFIVKTQ